MQGLELSKKYFETYGRPMLEESFSDFMPYLSAGLIGCGSECLGFDDELSEDHDFEPGFCIFLPDESVVDRKTAFQLERAYAKLPSEFEGYKKNKISPVGGSRHGVIRFNEFLKEHTGTEDGILDTYQWLHISEQSLLEVTNGEIFFDNLGLITKVRNQLKSMPEAIRKKRLAGNLLLMAQSGQYNYTRCIKHKESAAAQMAVFEFTKACISSIFLLNKEYEPYYKWSFRALRKLPTLSIIAETLEYLITTCNDDEFSETKYQYMEEICSSIIDELQNQELTDAICGDLEKHAYSVNDKIEDSYIRNLNILETV